MVAEIANSEDRIRYILECARRDPAKGRYYTYERYKSELSEICESAAQYDQAIIQLARILRV